ncbi:MAG: fibrobacter succinogenes major paralogous domain-containing protein [Bacteroidota bacterium]
MLNPFKPANYFFIFIGFLVISASSCNSFKREKAVVKALLVPTPTVVKDIDGNSYKSVKIGKQEWLVENLKTTRYQNGDAIPVVSDEFKWKNLTTGAYCNYENDTGYYKRYGRLYNWYALNDSRKICPKGWHVPTDADWDKLTSFLGGEIVAGGKMKESKAAYWDIPNIGATNESGFTALPGGYRSIKGEFNSLGSYTFFWSSTGYSSDMAWCRYLQNGNDQVERIENYKRFGFSVRCIKD